MSSQIEQRSHLGTLLGTIELEIIPRLLRTYRPVRAARPAPASARVAEDTVARLTRGVLDGGLGDAMALLTGLQAEGVEADILLLELLAPAARRLGALWDDDRIDFVQVTVGLWRLQQLMHELGPAMAPAVAPGASARRAMLVPAPGAQHTLGLLMVAEFFRREGWLVWGDPAAGTQELHDAARSHWFDVVGFSAGTHAQAEALAEVIPALRRASLNPEIAVMVGGPVFAADPELAVRVGADATAADAAAAVECAVTLMAERQAGN
jgi:methanogenic corrinoid protein MtbC1